MIRMSHMMIGLGLGAMALPGLAQEEGAVGQPESLQPEQASPASESTEPAPAKTPSQEGKEQTAGKTETDAAEGEEAAEKKGAEQGQAPGKYYAGAAVAQELTSKAGWDDGTALLLRGGMVLDPWLKGLTAEVELSRSVSPLGYDYSNGTIDATVTSLGILGQYGYPVWASLEVTGRLGLRYSRTTYSADHSSLEPNTANDTNLTYGAGLAYGIGKRLEASLAYTYVRKNITHLSLGAAYRF